jgi:hypothetical protein
MKYYIYVSDAKVDMLLPQIPATQRKRIAAELKVNISILSGTVSIAQPALDNRISRLMAVTRYLETRHTMGSIDHPEGWVYGRHAVHWALTHKRGVVAFYGRTDAENSFFLGGSAAHLIGGSPNARHIFGVSNTPTLMRYLKRLSATEAQSIDVDAPAVHGSEALSVRSQEWYRRIAFGRFMLADEPPVLVEFIARPLATFEGVRGQRAILATPLYVASAD